MLSDPSHPPRASLMRQGYDRYIHDQDQLLLLIGRCIAEAWRRGTRETILNVRQTTDGFAHRAQSASSLQVLGSILREAQAFARSLPPCPIQREDPRNL